MNDHFDELTKGMAQSVTRRGALKKFGIGLAGMALACFGLANKAEATLPNGSPCSSNDQCRSFTCSNGRCVCRPSGSPCVPIFNSGVMCCSGRCLPRGGFRYVCA